MVGKGQLLPDGQSVTLCVEPMLVLMSPRLNSLVLSDQSPLNTHTVAMRLSYEQPYSLSVVHR